MKPQQKQKRWKSEKYLKFVRSLPCCFCGGPESHVHHLIGTGNTGGMGMKAPDHMTMPLCVDHHHKMHIFPDMQQDQWEFIARTLGRAIDEGVIK